MVMEARTFQRRESQRCAQYNLVISRKVRDDGSGRFEFADAKYSGNCSAARIVAIITFCFGRATQLLRARSGELNTRAFNFYSIYISRSHPARDDCR